MSLEQVLIALEKSISAYSQPLYLISSIKYTINNIYHFLVGGKQ